MLHILQTAVCQGLVMLNCRLFQKKFLVAIITTRSCMSHQAFSLAGGVQLG